MRARPAHPEAMQAARPGRTRTAPPRMPAQFPLRGRYRAYTLFDATGLVYLLAGGVALRAVWALGSGPQAWQEQLGRLSHPLSVAFHGLALVCVLFVGVRFFRLFPKSLPPRIGPLRPPPQPAIAGALYAAWLAVAALTSLVLAGAILP